MSTDTIRVDQVGSRYIARASYDQRAIPKEAGFRWDPTNKVWYTADPAVAAKLSDSDAILSQVAAKEEKKAASISASRAASADIELPCPEGLAYLPYQRAGIAFGLDRESVLFGDDPGLGKTIQAIGIINSDPTLKKILVICPATLRMNWRNELNRWLVMPRTIVIAEGSSCPCEAFDVTIINYDILPRNREKIDRVAWDIAIIDEAHYCKTPDAKRTIAVVGKDEDKRKCTPAVPGIKARRRVMLTGTPIPNRPIEGFPLFHYLAPTEFRSFWGYAKQFCAAEQNRYGWALTGSSNLGQLQDKLRSTCFPSNTMIQSELGQIPIGEIVNHELAVRVASVNVETAEISWRPIKAYSRRTSPRRMVRVQHELGQFTCTPDHQVWTGQWDRADSLVHGMPLLVVPQSVHGATREYEVLLDQVCSSAQGVARNIQAEDQCQEIPESSEQAADFVPELPKALHIRESTEEILLSGLLCKMALRSDARLPRNQGSARESSSHDGKMGSLSESTGVEDARYSTERRTQDEDVYFAARGVGYQEGSRVISISFDSDYQSTFVAPDDKSASYSGGVTECANGITGSSNRDQRATYIRGHRDRNVSDRSRRSDSCAASAAKDGQDQGFGTQISRVLGVEILELGDRGGTPDGFVYDIEIDDTHTFFADGVLVHNCMVRRLKADVLTELPAKRRAVIELAQNGASSAVKAEQQGWSAYQEMIEDLRLRVELAKASDKPEDYEDAVSKLKAAAQAAFTEMAKLRHATAVAKIPYLIQHINDSIEGGKKVIVFVHHKDVVAALEAEFGSRSVSITGDTPMNSRQSNVERFQSDPECLVFIGNIQAAGVGITLTASSHVIFGELDWVPGNVTQCEDRAHRIGQKEMVLVQHLVLEGSLDAKMARTIVEKQNVIDQALDKEHVEIPETPREAREKAATESTSRDKIGEEAAKMTPERITAVHQGLKMLAGMDADFAREVNNAGFSKIDVQIGHSLAERWELTPRQAALGSKLVNKYRRQLPTELVAAAKGEVA